MLNTLGEFLILAGALATVISTAVPLAVRLIKKSKQFKQERDWNKILELLPQLVIEAESFISYTGIEKKEFGKSSLAVFAVQNTINLTSLRLKQK